MVVSVLGLAMISMLANMGSMIAINQLAGIQAFYIAEAGIERAIREIRDDASITQTTDDTAAGYCVTPCLDGYSATSTSGTATNACF
jgi:H2-forming N5,N10-methylenetetrahydromethanopterin dehydrogenase-like enzyme